MSGPERLRRSFEELGPTYVKLGQVLATRPDLIPDEYAAEFSKLHDQVSPLPFAEIETLLKSELKEFFADFSSIEAEPLGSASIAQVHRAQLKSGEKVVIKVQRPGILDVIQDDLSVLFLLADGLEKYVPESRAYNPRGIVNEYFKTLELETNFIVEGNNLRRMKNNFPKGSEVRVPTVYWNYCTEKVLVMEAFEGTPLSQWTGSQVSVEARDQIFQHILKGYMKMVFVDGLFHGDLHAGNVIIMENQNVGLIDFGVVGRLTSRTQSAIVNMLLALKKEDYERMALEYVELAPFSEAVNLELFSRDLRELLAPFYGLTLKDVNLGKLLLGSAGLAAEHGLTLPSELLMFFKSLVGIESLGRKIQNDFDFLTAAMEFAEELSASGATTDHVTKQFSTVARDSQSLFNNLPRQLNFMLKKLNSPGHAFHLRIENLFELKRAFESSFNLVFLGLIISALIISGTMMYPHAQTGPVVGGLPTITFLMYMMAGILGIIAFINYIRKP
ncbi:MAG: AarF/UbiB family protein [Bdellovibrionota bacterium]